jgi:hypothetical protein
MSAVDEYERVARVEFEDVELVDDRDFLMVTATVVTTEPEAVIITLPTDFDTWTIYSREDWAGDQSVGRQVAHERARLYAAWLALHPDQDPSRHHPERQAERSGPVFVDVAAVLDGGLKAPTPDGGPPRTDGAMVLYRAKVNALFGDPESAKTLLALTVLAHELRHGRHASFIDTDHNGAEFVLRFLLSLGVPRDALVSRLHYAEPDDREELLRVVEAVAVLESGAVVLDSVGENLTIWGVSSNDDQGFIDMNRSTAARLAKAGHLVITIDHLAKNTDSRRYGATGTTAKLRAANGAVYEVRVIDEFSPDDGGKSALILKKDRSGGVRALGHKKGDTVAVFELSAPDAVGQQTVALHPGGQTTPAGASALVTSAAGLAADVTALMALIPPPASKSDVMSRMTWGTKRALDALRAYRTQMQMPQPATSTTTGGTP